ncbi:MAG: hypothetical protein COY38_04590 [Candidatus Aenigmarchaeota archaeon CG_4_10_14_0_8_um_filter_37_24]|nr:nucleotidyl transferase AbiEii/AbiGii toxin family protein [Candidatus Aenigmarchaeota archaeon]OIN88002.1 MAG: hypothetical protein AUJ50_01940 [Candidatus Aenigmarchaeota archaeon CG1_02_38_14]PIV69563.1 MAG: hypothetical protein COS07_00375 [Candidatus Aenigmarchaeota archaeon CG01_land_8_20_14_3_00_37_9]PIW41453.1 MAG: hypothetical protein COW21_01835 [Candidatus Aenigmarchaeota archaeon CG15_BIG_FIL_POST_REV_8_21_14_020_37_27]PIX50772.1 MAG: hypothetical protein COZ52_02340 [Candidatus 
MPVTIPIKNKLKKKAQKDLAVAQDLVVIEMYNSFPKTVIHGGTCIWRCYGGNRFSEDIDVYLPENLKKSKKLKGFIQSLERIGFQTEKFKETENSIFAKFSYQGAIVSFEAVFKDIENFATKPFEMADGTFINVYTFEPEELIREKVAAYKKRRKVRDIYDIFFLLNFANDKNAIKSCLKGFFEDFHDPIDQKDLKALIITGAIPQMNEMVEAIKRWEK